MRIKVLWSAFLLFVTTSKMIYGLGMIRHGLKYSYYDLLTPYGTNLFSS